MALPTVHAPAWPAEHEDLERFYVALKVCEHPMHQLSTLQEVVTHIKGKLTENGFDVYSSVGTEMLDPGCDEVIEQWGPVPDFINKVVRVWCLARATVDFGSLSERLASSAGDDLPPTPAP